MSPVSSTAKKVAVSGARIVPPIVAAIAISGQNPGDAAGRKPLSVAPIAPPMMRSGARTPPDVPDPSATDQITALATSSPAADAATVWPSSIILMFS